MLTRVLPARKRAGVATGPSSGIAGGMRSFFLLTLLAACSETPGPLVRMAGDGFFDAPWPSDSRTIDGRPDLAGFPGREEHDLVDLYASDIEGLDGFATNGPVWFTFEQPPDTGLLPDPAGSVALDSPILFLDVDPDSPGRGTLVPWTWHWQESATTFQPDRQLAVLPLWGAPLHPARTYAVVLTTDLAGPSGDFPAVFDPHHPDHATWASLGETLFQLGIDSDRVAAATLFTTQDPLHTVQRTTSFMRATVSTPALDQVVRQSFDGSDFRAYEGQLWLPVWQHGDKPYTTEGGGFAFDEAGVPLLYGWERTAFTISVPDDDMPADGYPVVVYMHGTGGDHTTFANGTGTLEPASVLARRGILGIGISLPLHGDRGTGADPSLLSFNYFNPTAARGNFQQATLDVLYLVELMTSQAHGFTLLDRDGQPAGSISTDPDRVAYMGHSHGGIVGAMAAPWLGDRVPAVFLSGAGGVLSLSVEYRAADGLDIQELIRDTFDLGEDEQLDSFHPLIGMVQTLGESVDPINYAPYWHDRQPWWEATPASVLMTTGLEDEYTPTITAQVMAGAAGIPIIDPVVQTQPINELRGLVGQATPVSYNLEAWDGTPVSGGIVEFEGEGHFPIFTNRTAVKLYQNYLDTALAGQAPEIYLEWD